MRLFSLLTAMAVTLSLPAYAQELAPAAEPEQNTSTYNEIYNLISRDKEKGVGSSQPYLIITTILQMMPPADRQKLVMKTAQDLQATPHQKRLEGLQYAANIVRSCTKQQHDLLAGQILQTLDMMTPVEQQIVGVQVNKLLKDLPQIPIEDRNALAPLMNSIISRALQPR